MLLKEQWKSAPSQGLAPGFDCFLFLPHSVQPVVNSRTGHLAHSFVLSDIGCKREFYSCDAAGSTTPPKPCAGRNTHAMLCWPCAAIPIQAQASLAVAFKGWGQEVTPHEEIWGTDGMKTWKIRGIFFTLVVKYLEREKRILSRTEVFKPLAEGLTLRQLTNQDRLCRFLWIYWETAAYCSFSRSFKTLPVLNQTK